MDPRLLRAYNDELTYLREAAREFGEEHEGVAGRLGLKTPTDPDPYVERLLEGVAFLNARVNLKLQDQFPDFTQHLLHAIQPHYLSPMPSMCIVGFEPIEGDPSLAKGVKLPRLTDLNAVAEDQGGAQVTFRTGHEVTLWPLKIVEAEYLSNRVAVSAYASAAGVRAEAGLRLRFATTGGAKMPDINPATLPMYLAGSENMPGELYRQLIGETLAVVGRSTASAAGAGGWIPLSHPRQVGFDDDEALLPPERRSARGYRLLSEYFACPERFLFASLDGLGKVFSQSAESCDVILLFNRSSPALSGAVTAANFKLFAAPAINLFEKQIGRVPYKVQQAEHQLIVDRVRPLDFEVFRILDVVAYGRSNADPRPVAPLYAFGSLLYDWREALFYTPRLRPQRLSTKEQRLRRRTDYTGVETWISLSAAGDASRLEDIYELGVRALVTNRELPEMLRFKGATDFVIADAPVRAVRVLRAPTRPRMPMGLNDSAWRVIAHVTPNYASLASPDHNDPSALRDHLALYGRSDESAMRRQIDGVLGIQSEHVTRRVSGQDRMAFGRGLKIKLKLDDAAFENARMFLFSAVLERFLGEFATINSFTESVFESPEEGVFARWPLRTGQRHQL